MVKKFDDIIILHCVDTPERKEHIINELDKVGLTNYRFWETCVCKEINYKISKQFPLIRTDYYESFKNDYIFANVFDVAYNFYKIIKTSYIKGLNNILIMEDDIIFTVNKNELSYYFNNIPSDFDIIKFGWIVSYQKDYNTVNEYIQKKNLLFVKAKNEFNLHYNGMFALSRNGMKYFIDYMESKFVCADVPFYSIGNEPLNYYMTNKSLVTDDVSKTIIGDL